MSLLGITGVVGAADTALPDADATRRVVAAVVAEANRLARIGVARRGDDLTDYYVRAAAAEARRLPRAQAVPAFLAALGIALDDSMTVRGNRFFGPFCRRVESDADRADRLRVLGGPSLRHRARLVPALRRLLHADRAGRSHGCGGGRMLKERLDMGSGGSGFGFADLAPTTPVSPSPSACVRAPLARRRGRAVCGRRVPS
jgi:hypothetical protein